MKNLLIFILFSFIISSCVTAADLKKQNNIAQTIKKEGDVFQAQGDYTKALGKLLEAEKLIPENPYLQNSLGLTYMSKERNDLAVKSFQNALTLKPDYIEALNNLGAVYLRQKKWEIAIECFKKALDNLLYLTPQYPLSNIGWAYLGRKKFHLAETYFQKALDEQPWFLPASHGLAQVYLQTGQLDQAMDYLHKCLQRNPDIAILHSDQAEAYEKKGFKQQAIKSYQLVLKLVPERSSLAKKAENRLSELY
ncbi:MAG: tetratricopeptide repeat protein [Desulfobacteraceae bacterium]|nr:tetratricopeptide repeat protein [Desulfobacteraceae bacterium]